MNPHVSVWAIGLALLYVVAICGVLIGWEEIAAAARAMRVRARLRRPRHRR